MPITLNKPMKPLQVKFLIDAQDMERAIHFYTSVLGFEPSFSSPYWSEVKLGDVIIGIHGDGSGEEKATGLSLQYENIKEAYECAIDGGAIGIQEPEQSDDEPIVLAVIQDTEGNEIMLTQYAGE